MFFISFFVLNCLFQPIPAQIDIQSVLNGTAKFCRHCDVVIINNLMRKKASEMPLVAKQGEEDLYFCSSTCYTQLALAHPQQVHNDKVIIFVELETTFGGGDF